jgi:hypothetical protein
MDTELVVYQRENRYARWCSNLGPMPRARWFFMAAGCNPQRAASWSFVK